MKLGSGILKYSIQKSKDENFHFQNSLVLTDDPAFQQTHFRKTPTYIPRLYKHDMASDKNEDLPLQNRSTIQNNELLKISILKAMNACKKETSHAIIDSGASCCVTPCINDLIHQPTPIQNTTLKCIAGGLTALGRETIQLKINQENKETKILVIDNVIYAPDCPIQLISPQQLHRQSQAKGNKNSCFTIEENIATIFHGRYINTRLPPKNKNTNTKLINIQN
jgi:RNA-binding protein YhbY